MLEAQVVVEARSVVLLDDKARVLGSAYLGLAARLGGLLEIPLGLVVGQFRLCHRYRASR